MGERLAVPTKYGFLDKKTSLDLLVEREFNVPQVFTSIAEAQEHVENGGEVFLRPYFPHPWDSAIFLPFMDSSKLEEVNSFEIDTIMSKMQKRLKRQFPGDDFSRYVAQFGVKVNQIPDLGYLLQAKIFTNNIYQFDEEPVRIICMQNGEYLHLEWKVGKLGPTNGLTLYNSQNNYPLIHRLNSHFPDLSFLSIANTFNTLIECFPETRNLQVEMCYGMQNRRTLSDPELFVTQVRDFPQLPNQMWTYGPDYLVPSKRGGEVGVARISQEEVQQYINPDTCRYEDLYTEFDHSSAKVYYDVQLEANNSTDYNAKLAWHIFPKLRNLRLMGRHASLPLSHDLFSLVQLVNLRGGQVILG